MISKLSLLLNLALGALLAASCGHEALQGLPRWDGHLWPGDASVAGVHRSINGRDRIMSCANPKFENMVCMTYQDLAGLYYAFVNNCRDWYTLSPAVPGQLSKEDALKLIDWYESARPRPATP